VIARPALADPDIGAATLNEHLDQLWATGRPEKLGWRRIPIDKLHTVVVMHGIRADKTVDEYYVLLGAEYYDAWPPTVAFVLPETWAEAKAGTRWLPAFNPPGWFGLHPNHDFPDDYKPRRQLVCFSGTAQYYMSDHNPTEAQAWRPGERTVAMTLTRLELLLTKHYIAPAGEESEAE
jgi:hypothetical protein